MLRKWAWPMPIHTPQDQLPLKKGPFSTTFTHISQQLCELFGFFFSGTFDGFSPPGNRGNNTIKQPEQDKLDELIINL